MKILVCASSDSSFNSIRPEGEIYIGLAKRGHDITVITHEGTEYWQRYQQRGVKVVGGHPGKRFDRHYIRLVRDVLLRSGAEVVYATNSKVIRHVVQACRGTPAALITYRGTTGGLYWHDPTAWLSHLHPRVDGMICVSEAVRDDVRRQLWWSRRRQDSVVAIHKGHDLSWYADPPADLSQFGVPADAFAVACVVNVRPSKGVHVLLQASDMLARHPGIHLVLVGKGMDQQPYKQLVSDSPMRERIHVLGYRFDAPQIIAGCQVLVQPSVSGEGLPRTVMESMSYGVPVVATSVGGAKEAIENGVDGFIIPPERPDLIAQHVLRLAADKDLAERFAEAGRAKIAGPMSSSATVVATERFFERCILQKAAGL